VSAFSIDASNSTVSLMMVCSRSVAELIQLGQASSDSTSSNTYVRPDDHDPFIIHQQRVITTPSVTGLHCHSLSMCGQLYFLCYTILSCSWSAWCGVPITADLTSAMAHQLAQKSANQMQFHAGWHISRADPCRVAYIKSRNLFRAVWQPDMVVSQ